MAGLTDDGLEVKTLTEVLSEIESDEKARINESLDLSSETPLGQVNVIVSDQIDQAWQALAATYAAQFRASATGASLDAIGELTGCERLAATKTTVTAVGYGTAGTVLSAGRVCSIAGASSSKFESLASATLAAPSAWVASASYAVGNLVTNDSGKIYYCSKEGIAAGSGGPTGTGTSEITDGSAKWVYIATASAAAVLSMQASSTGPYVAAARGLTVIDTPVSGWAGVVNPVAGVTGRNVETDEAYRIRQEESIEVQGAAAMDAIRADLLEVEGVTAVTVFHNTTNTTDANGIPPNHVEALVLGGDDQDIADALWATVAGGIGTYGSVSRTIVDSAVVEADADSFPADGVDQIKQAIVTYWETEKKNGKDVKHIKIANVPFEVSGVLDVTTFLLDDVDPPVASANVVISSRQRASINTADIDVTVNFVEPS
jgi:uncharacterized phage protein gp47/JayE